MPRFSPVTANPFFYHPPLTQLILGQRIVISNALVVTSNYQLFILRSSRISTLILSAKFSVGGRVGRPFMSNWQMTNK
jgi:hypothetical protein